MAHIVKEYDERRNEIIETATRLFSEGGYDETSVASIIQEIGIAKGTFYHYFASKDELLEVIVDLIVEKVGKGLEDISIDEDLTALEKLSEAARFFKTIGVGWEGISKFLHEDRNAHWHMKLERKLVPNLYNSYENIVRQGVNEGVFHVTYPRETAIAMIGATTALSGRDHDHVNMRNEELELIKASIDIHARLLGMEPETLFQKYRKDMEGLK